MDNFPRRLAFAISAKGLKQTELCAMTGVDQGSISSYLSGRYKPGKARAEKLAKALGVNTAWLMGYDAPMEPESRVDIQSIYDRLEHGAQQRLLAYAQALLDMSGE